MRIRRKIAKEFEINRYLKLRLEKNQTNIYINGRRVSQCMFLLLNIPTEKVRNFNDIRSIDEAAERLGHSTGLGRRAYHISPKTEFWGHCSNLQAWYENNYDTRLMHRNLAFPLLKRLVQAGDPLAKKVFKEEIILRLKSGYSSVVSYLLNQRYLKLLNRQELNTILEDPEIIKSIANNIFHSTNVPKWFYKRIQNFIPEKRRREIESLIQREGYDAILKVVLIGDPEEKTQLAHRYLNKLFLPDFKMTLGVDFLVRTLDIEDRRIKLNVWDFDGGKRFRSLLPNYIRGANGVLFIYDAAKHQTLANIDDWLMMMRKGYNSGLDTFPIIVVGLVPEFEEERQVSALEGIKVAKSRGTDGYIECKLRTGENIEEIFEALGRLMINKM
ncbi:MAG: ADP-ribosylation factor-like protein [Candidatus Hermodarchaeota archaeon]